MKSKYDFTPVAKDEMRFRSGGLCEVNTSSCKFRATVFHHISGRGQCGVGTADNGLHCCQWCHQYIHDHPAESYERGWMRRSGPVHMT